MPDGHSARRERVVTLLLTYGEPPRARFLDQLAYSWLILNRLTLRVARIPRPALPLIALRRALLRVKTWRVEGFSSPLEHITHEQAQALAARLRDADPQRDHTVRPVFEFRRPLLPEVLDELDRDPPDRLLLLPLYMPDSSFTTGISLADVETWAARRGRAFRPAPAHVSRFSEDDTVLSLMAQQILEGTAQAGWSEADRRAAGLILGAHGTLIHPPPGIDNGLGTMQCAHQRLRDMLAPHFRHISVGWLNHTLGGEWTQPDLATAARDMVERGIRRTVYYPFGFLADNAETQLEGRLVLRESALEVLHLPCLNASPPFIEHLARRVVARLGGAPESSEAPSRAGAGVGP